MTKRHLTRTLSYTRRSLTLSAVFFVLACPAIFAQVAPVSAASSSPAANSSAPPIPAFDVATIKPHQGILIVTGVMDLPDQVEGSAATLDMLIEYAYGLQSEDQVSGGPTWAQTDRYDVTAKIAAGDLAELQKLSHGEIKTRRRQMLQALLADRFHLKVHSATKQTPVYDLVVAKGGPRLKDAAISPDSHAPTRNEAPVSGFIRFLKNSTVAKGYSMHALADFLSQPMAGLGRPVRDKTSLTGAYDFTLDWSLSAARPSAPQPSTTGANTSDEPVSIFTALADVGLKLQPSTGPIETIVIDHAERPTPD